MRARNIKPSIYKNHAIAELGDTAFRLFTGLWCLADRKGRLKDEPQKIQAELFPFRFQDIDMNTKLDELAAGDDPFIIRYEVHGQRYIQIKHFLTHQRPHHQESESQIPPWRKNFAPRLAEGAKDFARYPPDSLIPDSLIPDSLIPSTATEVAKPYSLPDPKTNPIACLVISYKTRKGVPHDSREWDSLNWGRCSAAAKVLISLCGNLTNAEQCLSDVGEDFDAKGMTWTLETIAKHAHDWLTQNGRTNANSSRAGLRMAIAQRKSEGTNQVGLVKVSERSLSPPVRDRVDSENGNETDGEREGGGFDAPDLD